MSIITDIDIDLKDRQHLLSCIKHIPAVIKNGSKHNVGIYLQDIPIDPFTGYSNIDYKNAEQRGYVKFDILNVHVYSGVRDIEHLEELVNKEPLWEMLYCEEVSSQLFQLGSDVTHRLLDRLKPKTVEELAMVIALIRPAKHYLINEDWSEIKKNIWKKEDNSEYYFKKSHAISYALAIVVQMNLLIEEVQKN